MATKARHLKTPLQLWIGDNRKRLGLTPADLAQMVGVTTDTARGWESRGRPSEDAIAVLERRFGVAAPRGEVSQGEAGVVAAIDRLNATVASQTKALEGLAELIREGQDRQAGSFDGLADGLLALLTRLGSFHARDVDEPEQQHAARS